MDTSLCPCLNVYTGLFTCTGLGRWVRVFTWGVLEFGAVEGSGGHSDCGPGKENQSLVSFRKRR